MILYESLSQSMNALRAEGYTEEFSFGKNKIIDRRTGLQIAPGDLIIDHVCRFEGNTDPADEAVLYAISSPKHGVKGLLVNGYGISSDGALSELLERIHDEHTLHDLR